LRLKATRLAERKGISSKSEGYESKKIVSPFAGGGGDRKPVTKARHSSARCLSKDMYPFISAGRANHQTND
jgi:hypothetical protein